MSETTVTSAAYTARKAGALLTVGNAAKLYCLQRIEELALERPTLRIVDLGAGDGRNFVELLTRHPNVSYLGIEPGAEACAQARRNLPPEQAMIVQSRAYSGNHGPADVVVSFSTLEHVYRRSAYLRVIAETLAPDGRAFVNYDAGHFRYPLVRDRIKNRLGPIAARLGHERLYQAFVSESQFRALVDAAGLQIVEARSFNTSAKDIYRVIPEQQRAQYMNLWLDFETALHDVTIEYNDQQSTLFRTRNFVLSHATGS